MGSRLIRGMNVALLEESRKILYFLVQSSHGRGMHKIAITILRRNEDASQSRPLARVPLWVDHWASIPSPSDSSFAQCNANGLTVGAHPRPHSDASRSSGAALVGRPHDVTGSPANWIRPLAQLRISKHEAVSGHPTVGNSSPVSGIEVPGRSFEHPAHKSAVGVWSGRPGQSNRASVLNF
jgi:hypothetical protein